MCIKTYTFDSLHVTDNFFYANGRCKPKLLLQECGLQGVRNQAFGCSINLCTSTRCTVVLIDSW